MIIPMLCVTIFVILVVWFLLPWVARLMIGTPSAISIFVFLSMVQLMAVFISMRCTLQHAGVNYLIIGHGPLLNVKYDHYSVYFHLLRHSVQDLGLSFGSRVKTGQIIGHTGNTGLVKPLNGGTGIHLHFYVTRDQP